MCKTTRRGLALGAGATVPEILVAPGAPKAEETNFGSGVELASGAVGCGLGRAFALLVVAGCGGVVGAGLAEEQNLCSLILAVWSLILAI